MNGTLLLSEFASVIILATAAAATTSDVLARAKFVELLCSVGSSGISPSTLASAAKDYYAGVGIVIVICLLN